MEVLPVKSDSKTTRLTRRQLLGRTGKAAVGSAVMGPLIQSAILSCAGAAETGLKGVAGIDRVTILPGKTYLRGWAGYGDPPRVEPATSPTAGSRLRRRLPTGPDAHGQWSKDSGPGDVTFADAKALITTATFTTPGAYVLRLTVDNGQSTALDLERVGGDAAAGQAARRGLHQEFQDRQPASGTRAPRR